MYVWTRIHWLRNSVPTHFSKTCWDRSQLPWTIFARSTALLRIFSSRKFCEGLQNFFDVRINFILILFDSLNVCLGNSAAFVEPFGNLVFVCGDAFHCYGQSTKFRHIKVDEKSVNCRFAEIGAHILRAKSAIFYFIKSSSLVSTKNFTCIGCRWFRLSSSMLLHCKMIQFKQFFLKFLVQSLLNEFLLHSCDKANVTEQVWQSYQKTAQINVVRFFCKNWN